MHCLVYSSQISNGAGLISLYRELDNIVESNRTRAVTGCIVFKNGRFLQYLEADTEVLRELYGKIEADVRHKDLRLIHHGPLETRVFSDWAMVMDNIRSGRSDMYKKIILNSLYRANSELTFNKTQREFWNEARLLFS